MYKKIVAIILSISIICSSGIFVFAEGEENTPPFTIAAKSAVLIDAKTGTILFEQNKDEKLPPASVTKIMTMILALEAIERGQLAMEDIVTASENAKKMGGSQINLDTGEQMTVKDILMSIAVASANDSSVAIAEHMASGSEAAFVAMMNERAASLGMVNTTFANPHGLPQEGHLTTAYDIALMSKQLISIPQATDFTSAKTYTIREGKNAYLMRNSNHLLDSYAGCIGIKTGFTDEARFCLSAAATREDMTLIGVVLGAESTAVRNAEMSKLLDYGFANYQPYEVPVNPVEVKPIKVKRGVKNKAQVEIPQIVVNSQVIKKGATPQIEQKVNVQNELEAPIVKGSVVGNVEFLMDGKQIANFEIKTKEDIERMTFKKAFLTLWKKAITM